MTNDEGKPDAAERVPETKSRLTPLIAVSVLLGFLLGLGCVFAYFGYETNRGLQAQIVAAQAEIKKKNADIQDMRAQIEALSGQIGVLKEYSVARSRSNGVVKVPQVASPGAGAPSEPKAASPAGSGEPARGSPKRSVPAAAPEPAKDARRKVEVQDCDLVGKSPEEQAETLKRCVSVMDSVAGAPGGSRRR